MPPTPPKLLARNTLTQLFLVLLILDAVLIILSKDLWAIGRIIVTAVIMYFVLQGHRWAKWLLLGILSLVVVALLGLVVALGARLSTIISVGSIVMAVLCCVIMAYLVGNKELQQYFASKRQPKT
ncbi:MAG: hypothetical protein AAGA46_12370 [Cyanobacteria bacterium P01_F01_bin.13]